MVVDGTSTNGEKFPCRIHPAAGARTGIPWARASAPKFFAFGRGAARRLLLRALGGLRFCSSFQPLRIAQCGGALEHVGLNQHGRGAVAALRFRLSSDNANVACSTFANRFRLGALFGSADLTLLAGDFVPGFQHYPGGAGP